MASYIVWIDSEKAKIFKFIEGTVEKSSLESHAPVHHNPTHSDQKKDNQHFYHQLAQLLVDAKELLIMGPGQAKNHFKNHLETHHHHSLAKSVIGVETVDHPSDHDLLKLGSKFFTQYDHFGKI